MKSETEEAFLAKVRAHPNDDDNRTVYADWLEEQGRSDESEFLRLQVRLKNGMPAPHPMDMAELPDLPKRPPPPINPSPEETRFAVDGLRLRQLAFTLNQEWRMLVAYAPIENCEKAAAQTKSGAVKFDFACPKKWEALTLTKDDKIRSCDACKQDVYYSTTVHEAYGHASQGRCVVVDLVQLRRPNDLTSNESHYVPLAGAIAVPPTYLNPLDPLQPKPTLFGRLKNLFK